MGVMICYDIRFPEFARTMVLDGAKMIFVPAAFNMTTGPAHWELSFRARALDNQIYMLGCAPARDTQAGYISWGHSIVSDPWGQVRKPLDEKEGILIEEIDLDREDQIREQEALSMLELTGEEQEITVTDSTVITEQSMGGGQGGPGGQASGVDSYDAANEYSSDETVSDTSLESTGTDENVALVSNGAEVTFNNDVISRTSSDSQGGDNSSFYGVGAAVLATDGTTYAEGDSDYTITVGSYQDSADTSSATSVDDWSNYETEKPENL